LLESRSKEQAIPCFQPMPLDTNYSLLERLNMLLIRKKSWNFYAFFAIFCTFLCQKCAFSAGEIFIVNATVTFIDLEGKNITISNNAKPQAKEIDLELTRKTKVLIAGKEGALESIKPGQKATVYYDPQLDLVTKIEIAMLLGGEGNPMVVPQKDAKGFEPMLPREGLDGWYFKDEPQYHSPSRNGVQRKPNWENKNGVLIYRYPGPSLVSDLKFDDFELELDFNLPRDCNCGVFLRGRYEVKLTDTQKGVANLKPDGRIGAIFSKIAPTKITYKGPYVWNKLEVKLAGQTVTVKINGETVINEKEIEGQLVGPVVDNDEGAPGPIMFFAHPKGVGARFRNVKIKTLDR
jgi:hypothetical protein